MLSPAITTDSSHDTPHLDLLCNIINNHSVILKRMPCTPLLSFFPYDHLTVVVRRELAVLFLAVVDNEVLDAHTQLLHLKFGAVGLKVPLLSAVPALDISIGGAGLPLFCTNTTLSLSGSLARCCLGDTLLSFRRHNVSTMVLGKSCLL
jgi:hypothetical protein